MNLKKYGILPVIILYMVFPLTFSIGKAGMMYAPSTSFIALRMILGGLFMLGVFAVNYTGKWKLDLTDAFLFFQAGLFGIYLTYVPEFWALRYLSVAKSALLFVLAPFFTALFSRIHGIETFSNKKILGLAIGMLGFIPIFIFNSGQEASFQSFFSLDLPEIVTIFSVACYAYSWIVIKRLINEKHYSGWLINGITMTFGGLAAGVTAFFFDGWYTGVSPITVWSSFLWYIFLITFVGIVCYFLYAHLLENFSATLVSFFGFTEPFFAALYGWIFLGETVSWIFFASLFIISAGLYMFYQEELRLG
jgi:drug/metabolite transporter (DMT)-like permease